MNSSGTSPVYFLLMWNYLMGTMMLNASPSMGLQEADVFFEVQNQTDMVAINATYKILSNSFVVGFPYS